MNRFITMSEKQRRRLRSKKWPHMKPHLFTALLTKIPYLLLGIDLSDSGKDLTY